MTETETCHKGLDKGNLHRISSTGPSTDIQRDLAQEFVHRSWQENLARDSFLGTCRISLVSLRHDLCSTVWVLLPGYFFTGSAVVPRHVRFNYELDTKAEGIGLSGVVPWWFPVLSPWCFCGLGGVSVVSRWCRWWCFGGALVVVVVSPMPWWCFGGVLSYSGVMLASCKSLTFI